MRLRNSISGERGIMALALIVGGKRCGLPKKGMASGNGRTQSGDSRASKNLPLPPSQPKRPNKLLDLLIKKRGGPQSRPASLCSLPCLTRPTYPHHRLPCDISHRYHRHRPVTPVTVFARAFRFLPTLPAVQRNGIILCGRENLQPQ